MGWTDIPLHLGCLDASPGDEGRPPHGYPLPPCALVQATSGIGTVFFLDPI